MKNKKKKKKAGNKTNPPSHQATKDSEKRIESAMNEPVKASLYLILLNNKRKQRERERENKPLGGESGGAAESGGGRETYNTKEGD